MAPSRRRGPAGKTSATTARSAAIQAAEKRRQEEREDHKNNDHETSTAKGVRAKSTNNNNNNNTMSDTGTSATTSTASSQEVVVTAAKQLLHSQPFCKAVPEDQHYKTICDQRSKCEKMLYKRRQDFDYSEGGYNDDDDDDDDEGCLHCHEKVKNMPRIRYIEDGEEVDDDSNGGFIGDSNIQVRCDDCRGYICNGCHWCHEFQANHEIRVCDRCDAFYCRGCDEMDQCDDCGEVVCGSCSTLLSCKFCGGGLCEDCATACGRCGIVLCSRDAKFAVDCDTCRLSYCLVCLASGSKDPCVRCGHRPSKRMEQLVHLRLKSIYKAFKSSSSSANIGGSSIGGGGGNHSNSTTGSRGNTNENNKKDSNGGRSRRNKPTTLQDMVGDHDDEDDDPTMSMMIGASAGVLPHKFCHDLEQNYLAEQKKADAAAEALLAELEEEETAIAQKKSKKKKKKERKNASKQTKPDTKGNNGGDEGEKNEGDTEANNKTSQNERAVLDSRKEEASADPSSETDSTDDDKKVNDEAGNKYQKAEESKMDPIEKELVECVNNVDLDGIESILFRLKGVPGRAALRKNAKKALKRLKLEQNPPRPAPPEPKVEETTKKDRKAPATGKVPPVASKNVHTEKTAYNSTKAAHPKSSSRKKDGTNRCEAHVEIVSRLVGWMIGKNGQRIRDLMEESGAKIWIDQEKTKGQETRNVYISGNRKSVDHAVVLVNEVITNAPPPQGTTNPVAETATSMANMAISHKAHEHSIKASGVVSPPTVPSAQSSSAGKAEVKSAWAKNSGSARGVDENQGIVPKPPAIISSSGAMSSPKSKEGAKTKPALDGPGQNQQPPGLLTGVPKLVLDTVTPAVDPSNKSNLQPKPAEATLEIVTCDVRFVPLLIGKRGWTIKNIQDDSGARVDIDQTVTPRQVRISGSKENVEKAVTMVRDVLSYPHAQLQSSSEGMGHDEHVDLPELGLNVQGLEGHVPISTPTKQKLAAASAILENDMIRNNRQGGNGDRVHSPPPVVGDAKTAISASSSLSSTPEPSMASSSKGFIPSHLQNCPPLPPPAEHYLMGNSPSQPVARQLLQPERGFVNGMNAGGLWPPTAMESGAISTVPPQMPYAGGPGQIDFQGGRPMNMPLGAPSHPQMHHVQQQGQHLQMNPAMVREQQTLQGNPNLNQNLIQQSFVPNGDILHRTAMQANPNLSPMGRRNLHSPLRDLMHPPGVASGPIPSSPVRGPGFADGGSRLWNAGNLPYAPSGLAPQTSGLQPHASSGFAASSMGFSSGHHLQGNEPGMTGYSHSQAIPPQQSHPNANSLSLTANPTSAFSGSIPPGLRNDDSRMIDSLFGGGTNVPSSNTDATNGLLTGFNALSLPNEGVGANPSGLWGSSNLTESWREGGSDEPNVASIGNLFSNEVPNRSQDHPQESRFNWD